MECMEASAARRDQAILDATTLCGAKDMKPNPSGNFEDQADTAVIRRIQTLIKGVDLDCDCRARLDGALIRFTALEHRRMLRQHLVRARQHRERIEAILGFLQEVDELVATEPDRSVYTELALLFDEVAEIARDASLSMNRLATSHVTDT